MPLADMNNLKTVFVALSLIGGIIGAAYGFMNEGIAKQPAETGTSRHLAANTKASNEIPPHSGPDGPFARKIPVKARILPGVFRGDWGETPVYDENDRVNYHGAAYLSLSGENQNQPPSLSPAFWRMVKKSADKNEETCFFPGPDAKLSECDFTEGNALKDMDLSGADLSKARLNGELGAANLSGADLSGAAVTGVLVISPDTRIDHANLAGLQSGGNNPLIAESANLVGTNFSNANLYGAKMKGANLDGAKLTGATLTGADLAAARLEAADLSKADLTYANLSAGFLAGSALSQADLTEADFSSADLSLADLHQANLAGTHLAGTNLSGANLRGANLADVQGADSALIDSQTDFMSAICPDGVSVDGTRVTTCIGHGF